MLYFIQLIFHQKTNEMKNFFKMFLLCSVLFACSTLTAAPPLLEKQKIEKNCPGVDIVAVQPAETAKFEVFSSVESPGIQKTGVYMLQAVKNKISPLFGANFEKEKRCRESLKSNFKDIGAGIRDALPDKG